MSYNIEDECVVCYKCIDSCPVNAIRETEIIIATKYLMPAVVIDKSICTDCGICKDICPVDAIVGIN